MTAVNSHHGMCCCQHIDSRHVVCCGQHVGYQQRTRTPVVRASAICSRLSMSSCSASSGARASLPSCCCSPGRRPSQSTTCREIVRSQLVPPTLAFGAIDASFPWKLFAFQALITHLAKQGLASGHGRLLVVALRRGPRLCIHHLAQNEPVMQDVMRRSQLYVKVQ